MLCPVSLLCRICDQGYTYIVVCVTTELPSLSYAQQQYEVK